MLRDRQGFRVQGGLLNIPVNAPVMAPMGQDLMIPSAPKRGLLSQFGDAAQGKFRQGGGFKGLLGSVLSGANAAIDSDAYDTGKRAYQDRQIGGMTDENQAIQTASEMGRFDLVDRARANMKARTDAANEQRKQAAQQEAARLLQSGDYEGASRVLLGAGDITSANGIWSGQENRAQAQGAQVTAQANRVKALGATAAQVAQGLKGLTPEQTAQVVAQNEAQLRALGGTDDLISALRSGDAQVHASIVARGMSANEFTDNARQEQGQEFNQNIAEQKLELDRRAEATRRMAAEAQANADRARAAESSARTATERATMGAVRAKAEADASRARSQATEAAQEARAGVAGRRAPSSGGGGGAPAVAGGAPWTRFGGQ